MIALYEQGQTTKPHVGACATGIRYPAVSSCITITFYFPDTRGGPLLVGAHFGAYESGNNIVTQATIGAMTAQMQNLVPMHGPAPYEPTVALVIGQMGNWDQGDLEDRKQSLYNFVDTIAPPPRRQLRTNLKSWDIGALDDEEMGGFTTAEITVSITGQIVVEGTKLVPRPVFRDTVRDGVHFHEKDPHPPNPQFDSVNGFRATDTFPVHFGFPVHLKHVQHQ